MRTEEAIIAQIDELSFAVRIVYRCCQFLPLNKCLERENLGYQYWLLIAHESDGFAKYFCKYGWVPKSWETLKFDAKIQQQNF